MPPNCKFVKELPTRACAIQMTHFPPSRGQKIIYGSSNYTREDLRRQFDNYVEHAHKERSQDDIGYDALDTFVNGLLRIDVALEETKQREPDMVFLQPTPVRIVLELVEEANITKDDVFYDLGSGLGQVPILVRLLTGAKTRGIEFEAAYCSYAQQCARRLNLSHVEFMNLDARDADYSDGTVFFMYTPFTGKLLQEVLEKLKGESRKRAIRICTYGPCTPHVSNQSWLRRVGQVDQNADHEYERYNQKLWIGKIRHAAYPWGNHTPRTARSRRKDTPCTRLPQMILKEKFRKSHSPWMNLPGREPVG